jgi:hypothetical protein
MRLPAAKPEVAWAEFSAASFRSGAGLLAVDMQAKLPNDEAGSQRKATTNAQNACF